MEEHGLEPGVPVLAETALADRIDRGTPVLVLFYADWCPYCQEFLPRFRKQRHRLPVSPAAANLSHPEDPRWERYDVETIPTLVAYRDGEEIARIEAEPGEGLEQDAFVEGLEALDEQLEDG